MTRVRSFFLQEAEACLVELEGVLGDGSPGGRAAVEAMYRAVRRFRGSAHMARFGELARSAGELERRLKAWMRGGGEQEAEAGSAGVPPSLREEASRVVRQLRDGVEAARSGRLEEDPKEDEGMEKQGVEEMSDIPIASLDTLEYRGEAALERALSLREPLEDAIVTDEPVGPILDELFDLIRLGGA